MDLFDIVISGKIRKEGGGDVSVDALSVTENGVYSASSGHAYSPVTVSVPQGVFPSGTLSIASNGTYDVGSFASADVNVSGGGGGITADDIAMRTVSGVMSGNATLIAPYAFSACLITEAIFSNVTSIGSNAFYRCSKLTAISFPNVKSMSTSAFAYCGSLMAASFPSATSIGTSAFENCGSLMAASFPNVTSIGSNAFIYCSKLMSLFLLASTVATLGSRNALFYTPMSNKTYTGAFGSIYVPASLVSDYKAAANWSAYADRITSYVEG